MEKAQKQSAIVISCNKSSLIRFFWSLIHFVTFHKNTMQIHFVACLVNAWKVDIENITFLYNKPE